MSTDEPTEASDLSSDRHPESRATQLSAFLENWPQPIGEGLCFMCGTTLNEANRSDEHVFPRWLQRKHELYNQRIYLLNNTTIPYRQLTIPCCRRCNNEYLRSIETGVKAAFSGGVTAVRDMDQRTLFLWLAKLSYGLIYREHFLPIDRTAAVRTPITPGEWIEEFRVHHLLLQAARSQVEWSDFPASIRVFETKTCGNPRQEFDYTDQLPGPFLAIRSGSVGIIATLQDWRASFTVEWQEYEEASRLQSLAPLQFRELIAHGFYQTRLFNRLPKLLIGRTDDVVTITLMPLGGLAGGSLYDPWDDEVYRHILAQTLDVYVDRAMPEGRPITFLRGSDGQPFDMPFEGEVPPTWRAGTRP